MRLWITILGCRFHQRLLIGPILIAIALFWPLGLQIGEATGFVGSASGVVGLVLAAVLWTANAGLLYALGRLLRARACPFWGFANAWSLSALPGVLLALPWALSFAAVGFADTVWTVTTFAVSGLVMALRMAFLHGVLGLSLVKILLLLSLYVAMITGPWMLFQNFLVYNYQTSNAQTLAAYNGLPLYNASAWQNVIVFNRRAFCHQDPQINDVVVFRAQDLSENRSKRSSFTFVVWPLRVHHQHKGGVGRIIAVTGEEGYLVRESDPLHRHPIVVTREQIIGRLFWYHFLLSALGSR